MMIMRQILALTVVAIAVMLSWVGTARAVTITEFTSGISAPDTFPSEIAPGPDGNVWFTERLGNRIGRITPTGEMTDFPAQPEINTPVAIAAGPDGTCG
jgi:virginiamycin B lyase